MAFAILKSLLLSTFELCLAADSVFLNTNRDFVGVGVMCSAALLRVETKWEVGR